MALNASLVDDLRLALDRVAFAKRLGIAPDSWQRDLLKSTSKRILLHCCRQSGKSTMSAILALHQALYDARSLVLCVAPTLRQSQELFAKISEFYSTLGEPAKKRGELRLSLELSNGSRILTLPGSEKTIRGFSNVSLIIVDEAARVDDALYYSVRPMLAVSGGALLMLSTPYGRRGIFFDEWTSGREWEKYEVPASQVARIPQWFLEEERESLGDYFYEQEYECIFGQTEGAVFNAEALERCFTDEIVPLYKRPMPNGKPNGMAKGA
jgi:hypothetical protein